MTIEEVKRAIRTIPDFPKAGIMFKDITTALKDAAVFHYLVEETYQYYKDKGITHVAGIESRGFIVGAAVAQKLGAGFILIRKPGKLPAETIEQTYELEYGSDKLEIHKDALSAGDKVLLHDDLLATGGSAGAAISLIRQLGVEDIEVNFIIELSFLEGRKKLPAHIPTQALISYD